MSLRAVCERSVDVVCVVCVPSTCCASTCFFFFFLVFCCSLKISKIRNRNGGVVLLLVCGVDSVGATVIGRPKKCKKKKKGCFVCLVFFTSIMVNDDTVEPLGFSILLEGHQHA